MGSASPGLAAHIDELRPRNRRWQAPAVLAGLGASAMVAGGIVFARAWGSTCYATSCGDGYSQAKERTGLVLLPTGAALVLIAMPMFAVRLARGVRLKRAEALQRLALSPTVTPVARGLTATLAF